MYFLGNSSSSIYYFFLNGWTASSFSAFNTMKNLQTPDSYWIFLDAPIPGNQWFEYEDLLETTKHGYEKLLSVYNLKYKHDHQIKSSLAYIHNIIHRYAQKKKIVLMGTSQGATIAFHYLHSFGNRLDKNITLIGGWFHNMAGFYPELLNSDHSFKYICHKSRRNMDYDSHSDLLEEESVTSLNIFLKYLTRNRIPAPTLFFYNSQSDKLITPLFVRKMFSELFTIYNCCV
jgi:predicted esterase